MTQLPPVDQYVAGFRRIEKSLSPSQRELLRVHYHAPGRTLTAGQLAKAVEYKNYGGVNLKYGKLGQRLREAMGWIMPPGEFESSAIASFGHEEGEHVRWTMHEPVAQALERLGWVNPK